MGPNSLMVVYMDPLDALNRRFRVYGFRGLGGLRPRVSGFEVYR